jgi:class 3 adenylate cyclase
MRAALLAHNKVLRAAIEVHDGFVFSHTGDGVVAAFASPKSAVDAAIAAQLELQLPVRIGIATGEAELRDGDLGGDPRVCVYGRCPDQGCSQGH